jgi:hypothetical protein
MIGLIGLTSIESLAQSHWTRKTSMPTARTGLAACVVEGKIYAIGGGPRNQVLTAVVERSDLSKTSFLALGEAQVCFRRLSCGSGD